MNEKVSEAVTVLKRRVQYQPNIGIILGSGLGGLADDIHKSVSVRYEDLPNFPVSSVYGHRGEVICGYLDDVCLLALSGRVHYYEGYSMQQVVFPIQVMAGFGVKTVIITNSVGAVNESFNPGDIVAIRDHINLMGDNPLSGSEDVVDLIEPYSSELRYLTQETATSLGIALRSGTYLAYSGPSYETPAEIRAMRIMGADMVGMSMAPEALIANRLGVKVLGLSMVTNMAAGIRATPLSHKEVIETSQNESQKFNALVKGIIKQLGQ
ncbi:MAG: purine-nucleoside phosphorylase [Desulfobacteraceae bacterium]|jgi:purine-nucleoside phosphorylase